MQIVGIRTKNLLTVFKHEDKEHQTARKDRNHKLIFAKFYLELLKFVLDSG